MSEEDREREQALKQFYENRVDQLMSQVSILSVRPTVRTNPVQIKEADRKAIELHEEYTKAVNSLEALVAQRDELQVPSFQRSS